MAFDLPPLPYDLNALEPYISANTMSFHYGKHHQAYVTNLNGLIEGTDLANKSLEDIIRITAGDKDKVGVFNNAAQVWNHTFYWHSMAPQGGGKPKGELAKKINEDFGSYEEFTKLFKQAGVTQFGSGWAWLVLNKDGQLEIMKTANADLPLVYGKKALFTCDVWEHAYYLYYQNRRPDYMETFLNHLINWDFAEKNFKN
jgi:Fe-Mn family superoxide dismutase